MATPFRSSRHTKEILVYDWRDSEELAAWYMRGTLELEAVALTRSGADGGIDIRSATATAQVKHYASPVGAPEIQKAKGASHGSEHALFFALSGFTKQAIEYASTAGVALFSYTIYGDVTPQNAPARKLLESAPLNAARIAEAKAAQATKEALEKAAEAARERQETLEQLHQEASTLAVRSQQGEQIVLELLRAAGDLEVRVQQQVVVGDATFEFIMVEYSSYYRPERQPEGIAQWETAQRLVQILEWAREGRWLPWKGVNVRYSPAVIERAAEEFLALYKEVTGLERLRELLPHEWAATLCDWELREAQISALVDEAAFTDEEAIPDTAEMARRVVAGLGTIAGDSVTLHSRWRNEGRGRPDDEACDLVARLNPLGLTEDRSLRRLYITGSRSAFLSGSDQRFPLGSKPADVEMLRETVNDTGSRNAVRSDHEVFPAPLQRLKQVRYEMDLAEL
jgi:hypothetical protein